MPTRLHFSNDIETLAASFAREITGRADWFTPCAVIVPNPYLQKWLQLRIAGQCGIAMNIDFMFLHDGLWKMADAISGGTAKPAMMDQMDLQLMLHHVVGTLDPGNRTLRPVTEYLFTPEGDRKTGYDRRIWQLSSRLSRYFIEYELYRENMVRSWIQGTCRYDTGMEAAQQHLYRAVFGEGGCRDAINKDLLTLPQYWDRVSSLPGAPLPGTLYLFAKSQLSPFHARMLYELGKRMDISLYQVNPCSEFWEDVTTPREDRWRRIRSIRIEENDNGERLSYDENENPLLKLWGKTGRETIKLLSLLEEAGSAEMNFQSDWLEPGQHAPHDTCLGAVREQILRRTTRTPSGHRLQQDTSIQIASCPEIFREAEAVYNSILGNLERDPGLAMTDIAIMVPDMAAYGPPLLSVFSREPRRLSFSMIDATAATDSLFGKGIRSILAIAAGSFTRSEIFGLAYNRCFLAAHSLDNEDTDAWLAWADALQVFHGFARSDDPDPQHNPYTWQQALQRMRLGRIMDASGAGDNDGTFPHFRNIVPYADMKSADQHCIDTFNRVIELLHARTENLRFLTARGDEWVRIIEGLISDFLAIPDDRQEEDAVRRKLLADLKKLGVTGPLPAPGPGALYSLAFITEFIMNSLAGIPSTHGSYLSTGINISALVPKRQVPFRIIYMMGMQEGVFPGVIDSSTLNLMRHSRMIGDVTRPDANRYLFLETLLSAREKIYITYVSKDLQKDKDYYPNSVVGQLITYLTAHVIQGDFLVPEVPPSGASDRYLSPGKAVPPRTDFIVSGEDSDFRPVNYSESDLLILFRNAARTAGSGDALPSDIKEIILQKIPDFTIPAAGTIDREETATLTVRDLANFLINPVESALRWHLGIYESDDEDRSIPEEEPFFTAYPHDYRFITDVLSYYVGSGANVDIRRYLRDYYDHAARMSITPDGAYRDIDYDAYLAVITQRLGPDSGLSEFIGSRKNRPLYRNVTFGANRARIKPDLAFPCLRFDHTYDTGVSLVELSGTAPFLWKDPDTGVSEALVITNSARPAITHIILPFLFYIAAVSGRDRDLAGLIGTGPFTIHVSHKGGITAYRYHCRAQEAEQYLSRLVADFIGTPSFDLLPLSVIAGARSAPSGEMKDRPDEAEMERYRDWLVRLIDDDTEKARPDYRPMSILQLLEPVVPADAYVKVRDRLGLLLAPFMEGGSTS